MLLHVVSKGACPIGYQQSPLTGIIRPMWVSKGVFDTYKWYCSYYSHSRGNLWEIRANQRYFEWISFRMIGRKFASSFLIGPKFWWLLPCICLAWNSSGLHRSQQIHLYTSPPFHISQWWMLISFPERGRIHYFYSRVVTPMEIFGLRVTSIEFQRGWPPTCLHKPITHAYTICVSVHHSHTYSCICLNLFKPDEFQTVCLDASSHHRDWPVRGSKGGFQQSPLGLTSMGSKRRWYIQLE